MNDIEETNVIAEEKITYAIRTSWAVKRDGEDNVASVMDNLTSATTFQTVKEAREALKIWPKPLPGVTSEVVRVTRIYRTITTLKSVSMVIDIL